MDFFLLASFLFVRGVGSLLNMDAVVPEVVPPFFTTASIKRHSLSSRSLFLLLDEFFQVTFCEAGSRVPIPLKALLLFAWATGRRHPGASIESRFLLIECEVTVFSAKPKKISTPSRLRRGPHRRC